MLDEYNALIKNGTWILVPKAAGVNMVHSMWLFKHKFHANGTLTRYKARLVANGSSQQQGIDVDETFSPVVKPATIRTVPSLAVSRKWPIHQLDFKNEFLNAFSIWTEISTSCLVLAFCRLCHSGWVLSLSLRYFSFYLPTGEFDMTDLGALYYFLGISAMRSSTHLLLSQKKYACELLGRANMVNYNPSRTPVDTDSKLVLRVLRFRTLRYIVVLQGAFGILLLLVLTYLMPFSRFDSTCMTHGSLTLLPLNVSCGTSRVLWTSVFSFMLPLPHPSLGILMLTGLVIHLHDALLLDIMFLGDNLLSWSSKRQHTISRSSAEAEYRGIANVVVETAWLCNLLHELHSPLSTATLVYCDNVSAVYMSANPVQHQRTKHIKIDIHFVRDMVQTGHIRVLHVPSRYQYADIFTKGLPTALFEDFRSSLSVQLPPAQTAGAY
uniref:Reverse transcriptase Ty1/copia-type domain-containing protein n=1 Tax=Tanacetum cinerariifolium TaxID=118510 RepID=A0A699HU62_TANCI|nr:hypothetical protein [Tanacetum cinerariifolium]